MVGLLEFRLLTVVYFFILNSRGSIALLRAVANVPVAVCFCSGDRRWSGGEHGCLAGTREKGNLIEIFRTGASNEIKTRHGQFELLEE